MSEQVENQHPFRTCIHGHDLDWSPCEFCIESNRNRRTAAVSQAPKFKVIESNRNRRTAAVRQAPKFKVIECGPICLTSSGGTEL